LSRVLSIRIPKKLKEEIEELKDVMDLKGEIIRFLEKRVRMYRKMKILREIGKVFEGASNPPNWNGSKICGGGIVIAIDSSSLAKYILNLHVLNVFYIFDIF